MEAHQRVNGQATVEKLSRRSTWIFILLAMVAISAYFLLSGQTADERASAAEINLAGKRRMLSQRIGLLSSQFLHEQKAADLAELSKALDQMTAYHHALMHGDAEQGIRPPRSETLRASYAGPDGVDQSMRYYLTLGQKVLQAAKEGNDFNPAAKELISLSQGEFLNALDRLVGQYQEASEHSTDTLRLLQWFALMAALGLLAFSALGVLKPLIAQVRKSLEEQAGSEQALLHAVEETQLILAAAGDGIFGVDRDGHISFANPAAATMLGAENALQINAIHHHEIMSTAAGCPICQVLQKGVEFEVCDGRFRHPEKVSGTASNDNFPVEYSVAPRPDGEGAVVSFRDISERWQAELKLQQFQQRLVDAIEALDDAFALFDADDRLRLYNLRFTEAFPLRGEIITIGMPFSAFIRAVAEQQFYAISADRLEQWVENRMAVHRRAEGSKEIPLSGGRWLRATERRTREGGTVVIWSDVSHLKQALIAADQASRAKSEFVARMSHELRTPLNAILGFAQVLDRGLEAPLTGKQTECVDHILQGGQHLLTLIDEILDLSAIEAGRLSIDMEALPLATLLKECEALVSPLALARQIALSSSPASQYLVSGDRKRLKQVLLNLLSNGIKYNRVGGQLTISIVELEASIRLTVTDTGHGIPSNLAKRVFQPFDRLGTSNVDGTGIGLSITRRLVELMEGRIGFDSTVGIGTSFWIELKKAGGEKQNDPEAITPSTELATAAPVLPMPIEDKLESTIFAIGLSDAENELLRLITSTLPDTRLVLASRFAEHEKTLASQTCYAYIVDASLAEEHALVTSSQEGHPPLFIALGEKPSNFHIHNPGAIHWEARPLKARVLARLLRKALP